MKVIVVGGGVIGSAIAFHLAKGGDEVVLVEQFDSLHRRGSSGGESRIIRRTYPSTLYARLMVEAYDAWKVLEEETSTRLVHRCGGVDILPGNSSLLAPLVEANESCGVETERLDRESLHERFGLEVPDTYVGFVEENAGVLNANRCVAAFQAGALKYGAVFLERRELIGLVREGEEWVATIRTNWDPPGIRGGGEGVEGREVEEVRGDRVVLAPGSWLNPLLHRLTGKGEEKGDDVLMKVCLTQCTVHYVKEKSGEGRVDKMPVFIDYGSWTPDEEEVEEEGGAGEYDMDIAIYGLPCREISGCIKVACHVGKEIPHPEERTFDADPTDYAEKVKPWLEGRLPWVDAEAPVLSETCLYTTTPDENFLIGPLQNALGPKEEDGDWEGVSLAAGFSGHGFKLAPVVARMISQLVHTSTLPDEDERNTFDPARYANRRKTESA